jgi:hypothetical protein
MITLYELLKNREFDFANNTIIVRHKDNRFKIDMFDLIDNNYLEYYQSVQSKNIFENKKYWIVFIGLEESKALLYNIYKINGTKDYESIVYPEDYKKLYPNSLGDPNKSKWYDLEPLDGFDDLKQRVIIKWKNAIAWVQNYNDKNIEVIEILPTGYVKDFSDYLDFTLTYNELKKIYTYKDANRRWIDKLSFVNGIYLILDKKTGNQYVGSAYGKNGIWGRWEDYINTGHGNNILLIKLLENDENYVTNFQWTVLETLPANLSNERVISYEKKYKDKLGTRAFGLNLN